MKKKLLLAAALLLVLFLFVGYRYLYKSHRDIASEVPQATTTSVLLIAEFSKNDSIATLRYAGKTILVNGTVTTVDARAGSIVLDEKISAAIADTAALQEVRQGEKISVKGRFVGYDDLLEELKMDQSTIVN